MENYTLVTGLAIIVAYVIYTKYIRKTQAHPPGDDCARYIEKIMAFKQSLKEETNLTQEEKDLMLKRYIERYNFGDNYV